ncbi:MAG: Smr/MutS family protein [Nitrosomonas sp.]|nr:Smr/MutS family protein [Nitrosomonas sp.]
MDDELPPRNRKGGNAQAERALFLEAMRGVKRLKPAEKIDQITSSASCPTINKPGNRVAGTVAIPDTFSDHLLLTETMENGNWSFIRPGLQRQTLRRLRRGDWPVQAQLDLHGLTREAARRALIVFLADCIQQGYRCVRVIHGKGLGSTDKQPVLKMLTGNWLAQHESVLAFCQARQEKGGSGALEVLLKKRQLDEKTSES